MISKTTIQNTETSIVLTRLLGTKMVKISFAKDARANDVIPYFNMSDEEFVKYCDR